MLYSIHILPTAVPALTSGLRYSSWILTGLMKTLLPLLSLLFPPALCSHCCYSPLRDFFLGEGRIWLIFLTFVSGFDSETFGSTYVQCPGSSLLTIWFVIYFFASILPCLCWDLPPIFKERRLAMIQPFCVTVSSSWF